MVDSKQPVTKECYVNKLRDLGFKFKRQADRVEVWRRSTDGQMVMVPRRDLIDPLTVLSALKMSGVSDDEINKFFADSRVVVPTRRK